MKLISLDKAIRTLVEHHGDRRLRDTLGVMVAYHARDIRQSKPPVRIELVGAGVNVTQEGR